MAPSASVPSRTVAEEGIRVLSAASWRVVHEYSCSRISLLGFSFRLCFWRAKGRLRRVDYRRRAKKLQEAPDRHDRVQKNDRDQTGAGDARPETGHCEKNGGTEIVEDHGAD